jgi:hypothetical protein
MALPSFANYVNLLLTLFDHFVQSQSARAHRGHPFVYQHQRLIVFFTLMHFRRIFPLPFLRIPLKIQRLACCSLYDVVM